MSEYRRKIYPITFDGYYMLVEHKQENQVQQEICDILQV